ncbi:TPA: DUF2724 domain-containing protein, partial [Klebsiella michiganensis]|nr:DUF2724 domain-containing protein [Klebsiella michiganensis]
KRSPSMHYGHGWIMGSDGQRWHPCNSQSELLNGLTAKKVSAVKRLLNALMGAK